MSYNEILALRRAKDCYMLDAKMSLAECVKYATQWDSYLWEAIIAEIRKAAKTDHLVQWEIEHTREDGVRLFDEALKSVRNRPIKAWTLEDHVLHWTFPLVFFMAILWLIFS